MSSFSKSCRCLPPPRAHSFILCRSCVVAVGVINKPYCTLGTRCVCVPVPFYPGSPGGRPVLRDGRSCAQLARREFTEETEPPCAPISDILQRVYM